MKYRIPVLDIVAGLLAAGLILPACGGDSTTDTLPKVPPSQIEVAGIWESNFGEFLEITDAKWGGAAVVKYDNEANFAVIQAPDDDRWSPGKFSRVAWTEPSGDAFHQCTVEYGADSADAAENTSKTADISDPENGGCGMFPWSKYATTIEIGGIWFSNYGTTATISKAKWDSQTVVEFDNEANHAITQNASNDAWFPNKFSRQVWTAISGEQYYHCTVDFGLDTAMAAKTTTKTADASDPENGGCGMFPWTRYGRPIEIAGSWKSNFGTEEVITHAKWGTAAIAKYDNDKNVAITQSAPDDMWTPNKFNRLVWTNPLGNDFYYCTADYGLDSLAAAETSTQTADSSDPENSGCGNFPWTKLSVNAGS